MGKKYQDGEKGVPIVFADDWQKDAFGALRTSSPVTYISTIPLYHSFDHYFETRLNGTASYSNNDNSPHVDLICPNPGDWIERQTRTWWIYQAGNSQLALLTGALDTNIGTISEFGYFGDFSSDGLGFNGVSLGNDEIGETFICLYSSIPGLKHLKVFLNRGEWNGKDAGYIKTRLAGTGLNSSKSQILALDLEFLAVGRVRVGLFEAGQFWEAHTYDNANRYATPYMLTASLPERYYLKNVSRAAGASMKQICGTVKSEGGREIFGVPQIVRGGATAITDGTYKDVLIISPKATYGNKANRASIIPLSYSLTVTGQGFADIDLIHASRANITGTLTGTWKDVTTSSSSPSCSEYTVATDYLNENALITNGHIHSGDYASGDVKGQTTQGEEAFQSLVYLNRGIDHTDDTKAGIYAVRIYAIGGNIVVYNTIRIIELY